MENLSLATLRTQLAKQFGGTCRISALQKGQRDWRGYRLQHGHVLPASMGFATYIGCAPADGTVAVHSSQKAKAVLFPLSDLVPRRLNTAEAITFTQYWCNSIRSPPRYSYRHSTSQAEASIAICKPLSTGTRCCATLSNECAAMRA